MLEVRIATRCRKASQWFFLCGDEVALSIASLPSTLRCKPLTEFMIRTLQPQGMYAIYVPFCEALHLESTSFLSIRWLGNSVMFVVKLDGK